MIDDVAAAEAEAVARYKETAQLARARLDAARHEPAHTTASPADAEAALAKSTWVSCMLLNTSEEALRAKHALLRAREQHAADLLTTADAAAAAAASDAEGARAEAERVRAEAAEMGSKLKRLNLEARQQRTRDASKLQAAHDQLSQLQETYRLSAAAAVEERRSEAAAEAQRERNLQAAVARLQRELEAVRKDKAQAVAKCEELQATLTLRESQISQLSAHSAQLGAEPQQGGGAACLQCTPCAAAECARVPANAVTQTDGHFRKALQDATTSPPPAPRALEHRVRRPAAVDGRPDNDDNLLPGETGGGGQSHAARRWSEEGGPATVERLRKRCEALETQCSRGVQLIEMLKSKVKVQEERLREQDRRLPRSRTSPPALIAPSPVYASGVRPTPETRSDVAAHDATDGEAFTSRRLLGSHGSLHCPAAADSAPAEGSGPAATSRGAAAAGDDCVVPAARAETCLSGATPGQKAGSCGGEPASGSSSAGEMQHRAQQVMQKLRQQLLQAQAVRHQCNQDVPQTCERPPHPTLPSGPAVSTQSGDVAQAAARVENNGTPAQAAEQIGGAEAAVVTLRRAMEEAETVLEGLMLRASAESAAEVKGVKEEAEEALRQVREELEDTKKAKEEAAELVLAVKADSAMALNAAKEEAEKSLESAKNNAATLLQSAKAEAAAQHARDEAVIQTAKDEARQWRTGSERKAAEMESLRMELQDAESEAIRLRERVRAAEQAARAAGQAMIESATRARAASTDRELSASRGAKADVLAMQQEVGRLAEAKEDAETRLIEAELHAARRLHEADITARGTVKLLHAALRDGELKYQELLKSFHEQTEKLQQAEEEQEQLRRKLEQRPRGQLDEQKARNLENVDADVNRELSRLQMLNGELRAIHGLNRMRASLLDMLREERLKLEMERAAIAGRL